MTLSDNKHWLAYALEQTPAIIMVVDMFKKHKKPKYLMTRDCKSKSYISLIFRKEEEKKMKKAPYLLSLSGYPDFHLILWNWEKTQPKIVAIHKVMGTPEQLYEVIQHPKEDDCYCIIGNGFFKVYKYQGGTDFLAKTQSPFSKNEAKENILHSQNYLSNCLLKHDDILMLGTNRGELLVINANLEYKGP